MLMMVYNTWDYWIFGFCPIYVDVTLLYDIYVNFYCPFFQPIQSQKHEMI
jgi:hypothetical protein